MLACMHMRTTVELPDEQHEALLALARRRGLRGFSQLVQEALESYLAALDTDEVGLLLSLEGSVDDAAEREIRRRIDEARGSWRAS